VASARSIVAFFSHAADFIDSGGRLAGSADTRAGLQPENMIMTDVEERVGEQNWGEYRWRFNYSIGITQRSLSSWNKSIRSQQESIGKPVLINETIIRCLAQMQNSMLLPKG
jgi:hypothetical protein